MPWDQRIARVLVRPLVSTPVTPNHISVLTLVMALAGAAMLAVGESLWMNWGAGIFVASRFLDHFDGELARQSGRTSRLGYYLDYISGGLSHGALFLGLGIGFQASDLGLYAVALGAGGAATSVICMFLNIDIDGHIEVQAGSQIDTVGYPTLWGFELEDGTYLLAPITWMGWLYPFFVVASIGASVYLVWTLSRAVRLRRRGGQAP